MMGVNFFTYFVVFTLCLFLVNCPQEGHIFDIDIGDYETHLEAWNSQNMPDYQIKADYYSDMWKTAYIIVRNGIPESSDPSYWLEEDRMSTIPDFFSFIKKEEERIKKTYNGKDHSYLTVKYNNVYHYPNEIRSQENYYNNGHHWIITLMPLEEGELDIDIGEYNYHLEAWNDRNMLDYIILVRKPHGYYGYNSFGSGMEFIVKNGIPDRPPIAELRLKQGTIPEIYTFIKEEEERIRNIYNGTNRSYLHVKYHTVYHYPIEIRSGVGHNFGSYEYWDITLTPEETE